MEHDAKLHRLLVEADGNAIRLNRPGACALRCEQVPATISACSHAILTHYGIEAASLDELPVAAFRAGIEIRDLQSSGGHLSMVIMLPMPWGCRRMTIATHGPATILLPGMMLSPAIAAAALGRPVGRLVGHPSLDDRADLLVTLVEQTEDAGINAVLLHFGDGAEPLDYRRI